MNHQHTVDKKYTLLWTIVSHMKNHRLRSMKSKIWLQANDQGGAEEFKFGGVMLHIMCRWDASDGIPPKGGAEGQYMSVWR